ncbi:SDR family NAD(P)-dependent oxidoreductase [Microbulbifer hydrolyticus]|uniref:SDR family NAD(P)-dependent oxidoreductase n=1 Tax=Microbulbifer hydrolyticus TaxID=48074 RepID=A0A6P1T7U3_9GAMM|nr:SDR family NAD(P)-dependent oxidoreductase [Microbulbifer hydrolyticus]MBB5210706.1 short-subunit dehydrogenase [Microbulbifer hydrolyticus]QHQ38838.1 SDR family NAD(P)-dependent oxidoreductase [Microbulbifer hydrolyticus]
MSAPVAVGLNRAKTFVVTGAAGGLGWALVQSLIKAHAGGQPLRFALVDVNEEAVAARGRELEQQDIDADVFVADLSCEDSVAELCGRLRSLYPQVDLLINNAGITHRSLSTQTTNTVIRRVMAVDYHAPVELAQGLLPQLRAAAGCVVNISSMAGWMPVLGRAGYCAAKSALHQYFETFREEVREEGVRVLMVYPSFVATGIDANALSGDGGRAQHAQSTIGPVRSAEWMADRIVAAQVAGKERLFPRDKTLLGAYLYKFAPRLFLRQMVKNFRVELEEGRKLARD